MVRKKSRSDRSPFPSRYSPGQFVTPAQYIIEFVCEQAAKHSGKDLPLRFWKDEEWENFFISQTRAANKLLKSYSSKAIIAAIRRCKIRSLHPKWTIREIEKEQKKIQIESNKKNQEPSKNPVETNGIINKEKTRSAKLSSSIDKLLDIDEEIGNAT